MHANQLNSTALHSSRAVKIDSAWWLSGSTRCSLRLRRQEARTSSIPTVALRACLDAVAGSAAEGAGALVAISVANNHDIKGAQFRVAVTPRPRLDPGTSLPVPPCGGWRRPGDSRTISAAGSQFGEAGQLFHRASPRLRRRS